MYRSAEAECCAAYGWPKGLYETCHSVEAVRQLDIGRERIMKSTPHDSMSIYREGYHQSVTLGRVADRQVNFTKRSDQIGARSVAAI